MAPVDKAEKPALKKRMSMTGIELKAGNDAHPDKGIPDIDVFGFVKFLPALVIQPAFACGMGGLFAHLIYTYGKTELYDRNIAKLADNEQGYVLLAAALFNLGVSHINTYPMLYKSMIMRFTSGNLRANMQIYKQTGAAAAEAGYVLLETQGPVGRYNRANRSLTHFTENSIPMAVLMVLCGGVFPLPTLALTALFVGGRVMHQIGYASIGYGAHAPGFAVALAALSTLMMLCVLAADKSLGYGLYDGAAEAATPLAAKAWPYVETAKEAAAPYVGMAMEKAAPLLEKLNATLTSKGEL